MENLSFSLTDYAHRAGRAFTDALTRAEQKALGQFMTPPAIARFMAQRLTGDLDLAHVRVLEPAAGAGILAAAVVECLLQKQNLPERIELLMYELDPRLLPTLQDLGRQLEVACAAAGVALDWRVEIGDFLLSALAVSGQPVEGMLIIANPPFFKLNKATDARAALHAYAVHGQPNAYGLFMAACARLTAASGAGASLRHEAG